MTWFERRPLPSDIVASAGVVDEFGNTMASEVTDTADAQGFGGATSDRVNYGVWNGAFQFGPSDPSAPIDASSNPLPYWSGPVVVAGGSITATWVENASAPSGHSLHFEFANTGSTGDEVYFQQIIDIGGSAAQWVGHNGRMAYIRGAATHTDFIINFHLSYLDVNGAVVGVEGGSYDFLDTAGVGRMTGSPDVGFPASPPGTAAKLRIRIGVERGPAVPNSATCVVDITDIRLESAVTRVLLADQSDPGTYDPGYLEQAGGKVTLVADGGVGPRIELVRSTGWIALNVGGGGALVDFNDAPLRLVGNASGALAPIAGIIHAYAGTDDRMYFRTNSGVVLWGGYLGVQVTRTAVESLATGVAEFINWDSEVEDPDGFHSNATNPARLTIPTGMGGRYKVWCRAGFASNATGDRTVTFWKNGASLDYTVRARAAANAATIITFESFPVDMAAGDYFRLEATQDSGGALDFQAASLFGCYRIS